MYRLERSEKLIRILKKLHNKDRQRYDATLNKTNEVIQRDNPDHYKNLSHDMKQFKRVHIDSHFVLIFKVDKGRHLIRFEDLQHHDVIYRRKGE